MGGRGRVTVELRTAKWHENWSAVADLGIQNGPKNQIAPRNGLPGLRLGRPVTTHALLARS